MPFPESNIYIYIIIYIYIRSKLKQRHIPSSDIRHYFAFHSIHCLGQTTTVGNYCVECAKIFKKMKKAIKAAKDEEEIRDGGATLDQ
jgi:hypothetical protein